MPSVQPQPAAPDMQRRHSSASSDTGSDPPSLSSRHTSQENVSVIPTRTCGVATSRPVANPLHFVKVGPCDLSRHAQQQLRKAEEVKKTKPEKRDDAEDWQSNLDTWKFSRRKRQEHIIERVVEVKKLELEEHDRNRRRSKTFNEMLEDRNLKGRKTSLPVYVDDDNDLSELGLSAAKTNGDDCVFNENKDACSSNDDESSRPSSGMNGENGTSLNGHSKGELSGDQEEYTYERAIQNYKNFTETRVRGRSLTPSETNSSKLTNGTNGLSKKPSPPVPLKPRRGSGKIEEKLSELEQLKKKSMSTSDLTESVKRPLSVPKVDILKRREMFEKPQEEESQNPNKRLSGDFGSSKSIQDRLSSLGKSSDDIQNTKKTNRISAEISVKDRLQNIEKQKSVDTSPKSNTLPNDTIAMSHTVKQRLTTLQKSSVEPKHSSAQKQKSKEKVEIKDKPQVETKVSESLSVKTPGETPITESHTTSSTLTNGVHKDNLANEDESRENSIMSPAENMYESKRQQHYRHRSLDSLDVDSNDGTGNESFERVQSLEDLDYCGNYPPSSVSGDTDREDSGIHTADVSSSVSQADDCDLHLDGDFHQQPTICEELNKNHDLTTLTVKQVNLNQVNVSESVVEIPVDLLPEPEVMEISSAFLKLPLRLDCDLLPVILESPSEPIPPITIFELSQTNASDVSSKPSDSSHNLTTSQSNVTNNSENDSNAQDKIEAVNTGSIVEKDQSNLVVAGGGENSTTKSVPVYTTLPVELSSTEVLHDSKAGAVEICQTIDISDLSLPLPLNPDITIEAECKLEQNQKLETVAVAGVGMKVREGMGTSVAPIYTVDITPPLLPMNLATKPHALVDTSCLPFSIFTDTTHMLDGLDSVFPLSPSTMEPPKEKPPPPPTEISDDDDNTEKNNKTVSLRRLDSTKRIKKEIRQKRSSFLGIEGSNDDYLEPELELVRRPPDITSFLAEEKRLEQLLYRQSICSESESRDSGVELEKHGDDLTWSHLTSNHSRDNSETYANTSTTSEEEEIVKKEREIIEMLEREEINRYSSNNQEKDNIGAVLAERLRELEAEKCRLEWEREQEVSRRKAEEAARVEQQSRIQARERQLCKQESTEDIQAKDLNTELLMAERERLEVEQAQLARQRDLILNEQYSHSHNRSLSDVRLADDCTPDYRRSMQDLRVSVVPEPSYRRPVEQPPPPAVDKRRSMPDLSVQPRRPPPPPPILPAKPLVIPRNPDHRVSERIGGPPLQPATQQMTRQTLQALAAAPKPRLNDNWLPASAVARRKTHQHWLVQEAEQRRITEHHQRQAPPPRRPVPPPIQAQQVRGYSGAAPQYTNWQPRDKPLPDSIIQSLTQRVQNRLHNATVNAAADPNNNRRRIEPLPAQTQVEPRAHIHNSDSQEKMLSVSGKKKCSHCGDELGHGAAMIIESLRLFYHIDCFKCCVCCVQLGDGLMGTDVRVRNNKLHCHNCYSSDDGVKFSCV